ncbi:MAG TPA: neuraminidase-like domain-containing protein [Candidatus Angelobacter sp.]|nr:neuraminidase-like domain-containing protein [Candidatus Angelobacter sp.]
MQASPDISIRLSVLDPQGQHLGGQVDIQVKPLGVGQTLTLKAEDASRDIDIGGLQRGPGGAYQVTVTAGPGKQATVHVDVPASGFASTGVTIGAASLRPTAIILPTAKVEGTLVFDNSLPAAGITVRAYHIGFAGQSTALGEAKTDGQGKYAIGYNPPAAVVNLQMRIMEPAGKEVTISATRFGAPQLLTLNLIVPASAQPLAPEYERLSADLAKNVGKEQLGQAQESSERQDLTLLRQATNWDARLVALAATAAQQNATTGLGQDVLYALYRVGLPTDSASLATVPSGTVQQALAAASKAGIVSMNADQMASASKAFQAFSTKTLLATAATGAPSTFNELMATQFAGNAAQQDTFARLYFSDPSAGSELWTLAAKAQIPPRTIESLRLQGKFLYLTFNNAALAQRLQQQVGSLADLPKIADQDYHQPDTWQATLTSIAGQGGNRVLDALIPAIYTGQNTADRLSAYAGDLARKIRISFPTRVVARMAEKQQLTIDPKTTAPVANFLRAADTLGYSLGRTPLNAFMTNSAKGLPALDDSSKAAVKALHRIFQVTPSTESLQAALTHGLMSANQIASYSKMDFLAKYENVFPAGEAIMVYGQAQTISSITFNIFSAAKALDTAPPVYTLSSPSADRQNAKDALVKQFPSLSTLFGNLDFCQCDDCRSVLSPAAYFVDLLDLLGQSSVPNAAGNTPLDVLIGKSGGIKGRRPDLGALPLTCSNTNTAQPYIDLVNEILEYYIAHNNLDAGAAYDTGTANTADLTAEPQHVIPDVYNTTLKQALYPLDLPFDLWIETVRGFLGYFKTPLPQVLDTLRPADTLELFTSNPAVSYYRAQILAEALGISPAEYAVYTAADTTKWFTLYGYTTEAAALGALPNAKTLSQKLGVSYQALADLAETGFLNPGLFPLIFQFQRFGIDMGTAFSFTNQAGYPVLDAQHTADFQAELNAITAQYKQQNPNSTFDATAWLKKLLPAKYSQTVLVLADPNTGCNFSGTTLQYADGSAAKPLDFLKLNLLVRLCTQLGCSLDQDAGEQPAPAEAGSSSWTLDEIDRGLQAFLPGNLPAFTDPGFAAAFGNAWKTALVYLAHLDDLNTRLNPALGRSALLPFWQGLPAQGEEPLYAQLFLTAGVLNKDFVFDDPNGVFPAPSGDLTADQRNLAAHSAAIQGVLGLSATDLTAILADAGIASPATFSLDNLSLCYRYSMLAQCLQMPLPDLIALKGMSGLNPFQPIAAAPLQKLSDDILLNQTLAFVKQWAVIQNSGFSIEDLKYLLRHQFDPVGKYQGDPNARIALVQSVAEGLTEIQKQYAVPASLMTQPETLIDQSLSGLIPAPILKSLFAQLSNSQTYTVSTASATALTASDFAGTPELTLAYDNVTNTQSLSCKGLLMDWRKAQIQQMNSNAALAALLSGLLDAVQKLARSSFDDSIANVLGVWASLAQYEAVGKGIAPAQAIVDPAGKLTTADPSLSFSYDAASGIQWLGYRGVITDAKIAALTGINASPLLVSLLSNIQQQVQPAYTELAATLAATWCNLQRYQATQGAVAAVNQIDTDGFSAALANAQQAGTITAPIPAIQIAYDPAAQVQTLTCAGVLNDALRVQLSALIPSPVLSGLLQAVRNQAASEFQFLGTGLLPAAVNNPDLYLSAAGVDPARQPRYGKAELVKVFLPLLARKLSRQLVLQTLSAALGSDATFTEPLVTDAGLLNDPSDPGHSLLQAFLAVGQQGVSASYYASANLSGNPQSTGLATTADTADATNSVPGTASCRFEGYLQVPTDGPYRLFAELGNSNAQANLQIDSPDPSALFPNPVLQAAATKDNDEASQFVNLKGGVAYHFVLQFQKLGDKGASLLIQGENLPKGPLSQVFLYAQQSVDAFGRAQVLLAKVLQICGVTGLDLREISYLTANAGKFNNLKLSALPTQASDDSPAKAAVLFSQFLTLADYADLRKGPAGGTDGLIDVFQAASLSTPLLPPATVLANLTRRDPQVVQDVGTALGPDSHFSNNAGIRRMWDALQLVQTLGLPVQSVAASTKIVTAAPASPDQIAANFENAVKAQYTPDQWRPIAQSVFDPQRRKKRDALVSYLVNELAFDNANQLFEYFLVDTGMEPVVQTSRLRLALSSVQTFIQRCFLNLESGNDDATLDVAASAIPADWWPWMKRYRVWEANREIFLFPENWMQPELRMDKTDLFQALESALLQGDVTSNLVEDAFLDYLKGLDLRARLDIVASYFDQNPNPGESVLYVLGRTYGHPHKYFTRTYTNGVWSAWEAVSVDIESDHIVLAKWRGRLNMLWLTFITKAKAQDSGSSAGSGGVGTLPFDSLFSDISNSKPQQQVQIQLHWSESVEGKWTSRISTDVKNAEAINVADGFDPSQVHIHVSKELDAGGNEGALRIHVDFPEGYDVGWAIGEIFIALLGGDPNSLQRANHTFRITSKNCDPDFSAKYYEAPPPMPYDAPGVDATFYVGSSALTATFQTDILLGGSGVPETEKILDTVQNFDLLTCANAVSPPFIAQGDPAYSEAGSLVSPFFFKDSSNPGAASGTSFLDERTFFVQPSLTETVVREWAGWAIGPVQPQVSIDPGILKQINIIAQVPSSPFPIDTGDPIYSIYPMQNLTDWLTNPAVAVSYGGVAIGKNGGIQTAGNTAVNAIGNVAGTKGVAVAPANTAIGNAGFVLIGSHGINASRLQALKQANPANSRLNTIAGA